MGEKGASSLKGNPSQTKLKGNNASLDNWVQEIREKMVKSGRISTKPKFGNPQAGLRSMWRKSLVLPHEPPEEAKKTFQCTAWSAVTILHLFKLTIQKIEDIFGGDPSYQKRSHSLLELIRQQKSKLLFYHSNGHKRNTGPRA